MAIIPHLPIPSALTREAHEVLTSRNWTGLSLAELASAGRVGNFRDAAFNWTVESDWAQARSGGCDDLETFDAIVQEVATELERLHFS